MKVIISDENINEKFYLFYLQELYKFRYLSGPYRKPDNNGAMLYPGSKNQEAHPY